MRSFDKSILEELEIIKKENLYRKMEILDSACGRDIIIGKNKLINFCSNNYLGLNGHKDIEKAMVLALKKWGTSAGASRLISGNLEIFEIAEKKLAKFKGTESSLIFPSGYQANVSVISTLMGKDDVIFSDELNHASIIDGCRLSKAKVCIYRHNDMNDLEKKLKAEITIKRKLIVTDSVFSMDGDLAKIDEIVYLADKYDSAVLIDDAHATGILGENGRGSLEHFGLKNRNIMVLATGGKALGVMGAFFCCNKKIRDFLINRCRGFIYSTGPSPLIPAGLVSAINVVQQERWRREKLKFLAQYFWERLKEEGYKTSNTPSHILPLIIGDNEKTIKVSEILFKNGIYARAIRPPTVPKNTSRIRFSITAEHDEKDIDFVINILKNSKI